jgi:predicted DNA-binding protein YlxM (UPF0122 family)
LDDLESRLRNTLQQHQDAILQLTADITDSRQQFVQSVVDKIHEVNTMLTSYEAPPSLIQLVAIDIDRKSVYDILQDIQFHQQSDKLSFFFEQILQGHSWESLIHDDNNEDSTISDDLGFVTKTHVTLAHYRDMSQTNIQSIYTPYMESSVELTTNAIYYNERIMALAIKNNKSSEIITNDGTILPMSSSSTSSLSPLRSEQEQNDDFAHITIWCNKGTSAYEANVLPSLVRCHKAKCVEFPEHSLLGSISFWYM